ncbi:MAG TPA: hypothetical protein VHE35_10555, partial [Kofleriaceae bacterium]|nr:hypothetical protein [Kofleriaceae bacterium]
MSNLPRPDGTRGRWARRLAALAFGVGLGLGTATHVPDASADAQHRPPAHAAHATHATHAKAARHAPHAPVAAAHGRAEPVATHRRARLALPPTEHVAIGAGLTGADQTPSAAATEAAAAIDKLLRGPLRQGTTGIYVVDADTGRELFSLRPDERLNPA